MRPVRKADNLHVPMSKKSGGLNLLEPCGPVQACNGTALPLALCLPLVVEELLCVSRS
jgi:hypothetical protein